MIAVLVLIAVWGVVSCVVAYVVAGGIRIADSLEPAGRPAVRGEAAA